MPFSRRRTPLSPLALTLLIGGVGAALMPTSARAQYTYVPADTQYIKGSSGTLIDLVPGTSLDANPEALAAFDRAAQTWANLLTDPITITIDAEVTSTGFSDPDIIGQTDSVNLIDSYDTIVGQLQSKFPDDPAISLLPSDQSGISFYMPTGFSLYSDPGSGNLQIGATKAELKALGYDENELDTDFGTADASITFNSAFSFDYDNSDGVSAGDEDFQTVATHEIGHVLGFDSAVDDVDYYESQSTTAAIAPDVLDLYRFSSSDLPTDATYTSTPRDLVPGDPSYTDPLNALYAMSTGYYEGDGRQASHWEDDEITSQYIGIMDPTLSYGVTEPLTGADVEAMHLLGYATAPEPTSLALMALALGGAPLAAAARRRRRASAA